MISEDLIAVDVKIADMIHNSDIGRLSSFNEKTLARMKKYNAGLRFFAERNFGEKYLRCEYVFVFGRRFYSKVV